jgi:hypothetical protein
MPPTLINYRNRERHPVNKKLSQLADAYQRGFVDEWMVREAFDADPMTRVLAEINRALETLAKTGTIAQIMNSTTKKLLPTVH